MKKTTKKKTTKKKYTMDRSVMGTFIAAFLFVAVIVGVGITQMLGTSYAALQPVESLPATLTSKVETAEGSLVPAYSEYISGVQTVKRFYGVDSKGAAYDIYCLERWLTQIGDKTYHKAEDALSDRGMAYLLSQIYPNNDNFLPGQSADVKRYISQLAIWYYQDRKAGYKDDVDTCSREDFAASGCKKPDPVTAEDETTFYWANSLLAREKTAIKNSTYWSSINQVVTAALNFREDTNYGISVNKGTIAYSQTADKKYMESSLIDVTATGSNFISYSVSVANDTVKFYDEQGAEIAKGTAIQAGKKFKFRVPMEEVKKSGNLVLNLQLKGTFAKRQAYMYLPEDSDLQKALIGVMQLEPVSANLTVSIDVPMGSARVRKTDATTGSDIPGATLVITDSNGKEVARWVSTEEPYYIEKIKEGTYTLTETIAPEGYVMSTSSVEFIIKSGETTEVEMKNVPEIDVPDTATMIPSYVYLAGAAAFLIGVGLIYISLKQRHDS